MSAPRELSSAGMGVFIDDFETFVALKEKRAIADFCIANGISNTGGANWRADNIEKIIKNKELLLKCLHYIAYQSRKATLSQKNKANDLFRGYTAEQM